MVFYKRSLKTEGPQKKKKKQKFVQL